MMNLYFHPMSGNSRRALLVAAHLQVPLERVVIDLTKGEQRLPAHLARNPNGRVPVLEDGDFVLWESRAIMQYLCDRTPGQTLWPQDDARARAEVSRWLFWCAAHMAPANAVLVAENFVKPLMKRALDAVELARGEALFAAAAPVLDAHLAHKQWVALDRLTIADYSLAAGFALAGPARLPLEGHAHIRRWLERVQAQPAWQQTQPQR